VGQVWDTRWGLEVVWDAVDREKVDREVVLVAVRGGVLVWVLETVVVVGSRKERTVNVQ
jgi:hypothetical protein